MDTGKPTSLAFARRVIESPHYDDQKLPNLRPSLFQVSQSSQKLIARGPGYAKKETLRTTAQMCQIYNEAKAVGEPSTISKNANQSDICFQ